MFYKFKGNKNYILFFACVATALVTVDLACISVALPKMLGYFSASKIEIKERFRILAKEWHPDKRKNSSEDKMIEINNAYEVLSDAHLREEYDKYYKFL